MSEAALRPAEARSEREASVCPLAISYRAFEQSQPASFVEPERATWWELTLLDSFEAPETTSWTDSVT